MKVSQSCYSSTTATTTAILPHDNPMVLRCGVGPSSEWLTRYCSYQGLTWCDGAGKPLTVNQRRRGYPICICLIYGTCRRVGCAAAVLAALADGGGDVDEEGTDFDGDAEYGYAVDVDENVVHVGLVAAAAGETAGAALSALNVDG